MLVCVESGSLSMGLAGTGSHLLCWGLWCLSQGQVTGLVKGVVEGERGRERDGGSGEGEFSLFIGQVHVYTWNANA